MVVASARQVSLVERIELPFEGAVVQGALALGDVNADGDVELAVGTTEGALIVFSGERTLAACHGLGSVVCVIIDDVLESGSPAVLALTAEGRCYVFDVGNAREGEGAEEASLPPQLAPEAVFDIPWNVTCGALVRLEADGPKHLVLAAHDGGALSKTTVNAYVVTPGLGGQPALDVRASWSVPGAAVSLSHTCVGSRNVILVGLQFGGFLSIELGGRVAQHRMSTNHHRQMVTEDCSGRGEDAQDGAGPGPSNLLLFGSQQEDEVLPVDKPTYVLGTVFDSSMLAGPMEGNATEEEQGGKAEGTRRRVDTDNSDTEESETALVALCFGGRLRLERLYFGSDRQPSPLVLFNELAWQEYQARQLFALQSLDLNMDGLPEIVSCAWDGLTCIYDLSTNVVRYQFEGRVQGFLAGNYSPAPGRTCPCFVYVTLSDGIAIYTDVRENMQSIPALTLVDVLRERVQLEAIFKSLDALVDPVAKQAILLQTQQLNGGLRNQSYYAKLLHDALYKPPGPPSQPPT